MTHPHAERYVDDADRALRTTYEEPMALATYVERVFENPTVASHAARYLLRAIESAGTRTVIEAGEELERYRFFDDPFNDGEHAVLGNTATLNAFVEDVRTIAAERGKEATISWFAGPTATGKSELKRCLINGLREFSRTPEGRRYTVEWNIARTGAEETRGLSYGEQPAADEDNWHESPVQAHPLSVFPPAVREDVLADVNDRVDDVPVRVGQRLDPFSQEAYDDLETGYRRAGTNDLFSAITAEQHLRVKNYVMDVGQGIGVLHAEDGGTPKERLVGGWMPSLLQELDSRGRKNPQAFSYDGVLSQGNNGVTIVEDAAQHADLVQKLLNVPEEKTVKLDTGISMDVDTQLILISNPDLEAQLNQQEDRRGEDPLKALKRRLDKLQFTYLTNRSLEVALLRRELADERTVLDAVDVDERDAYVREPVEIAVQSGDGGTTTREFAPHALEAAALYDVVTRLDTDDVPTGLDLVEKALLFDRGYVGEGDDRREADEFDFSADARDGEYGIPVTYTRDVLSTLVSTDRDRSHPSLPVETVVMPEDVLDAMVEGLGDAPVFAGSESGEYENRVGDVAARVRERQEADVLDAMLARHHPDEETVAEYIEHVYAWATGEQVETERGTTIDPDPLTMKVFEIEHLGRFDESDYDGTDPTDAVESFRREEVVTALNRQAWEQRGEDFAVAAIDPLAIPALEETLSANDWDDVHRVFEDFDPAQWADPPSGTETERLKKETIDRLCEGEYSRAAAELTTRRVVADVATEEPWD
ncbi:MAG: PrkA family serine protein kinase [Halopenitus sp.]